MSENEIFIYLENFLQQIYDQVISKHFFYIFSTGTNVMTLVAHLDTLRNEYEKCEIIRKNNILRNKFGILGADDRAGVYAILKIIELCRERKIPLPSVLFTTGEEWGGIGAREFAEDKCFTADHRGRTNLLIELDRRCANQYVYYTPRLPQQVHQYVQDFGFLESHGSFSDISLLSPEYRIPAVNLSVGFYQEHTDNERLHLDELFMTIHRVAAMLANPIRRQYLLKKERRQRNSSKKKNINLSTGYPATSHNA